MPIYEFVCEQCEHEFESFQRLSDPLPDQCPSCRGGPVRKNISAAGFRLKGGGWYETDFKSSGKKNLSGGDGKGDGKSDGSSDSAGSSSGDSSAGKSSGETGGSGKKDSGSADSGGAAKTGSDSSPAKKD